MTCSNIIKMYTRFGYVFLFLNLHLAVSQDCTLPQELWGNWTSTNLGKIVITGTSPSLTFARTFTAQNVTENAMECRFTSGSQYILESVFQIYTFSATNPIFMWMCLDLRRASAYSYYYYLNSPVEIGFDGYRLVGLPDSTTTASDVCTETPDTAEFHMMIKDGHETDAVNAVQCADPILGYFSYTYTDATGTYCENATSSYINACDNSNRTHVLVNNTDCSSINPFYSTSGQLGCIANVHNSSSDIYYISLYNLDSSPTTQFICIAVTQTTNGTVFLSMKQTDCESGQQPTTLLTGVATMVLSANYTCLLNTYSKNRNWTWLFIFLPCLVLLIIFIIVCICLYFWLKKRETLIARRKTALANADHPLGEVSMKLDAPASLGMQNGYIDRKRDLLHKAPQRRSSLIEEDDPFCEQSLDLNLETQTWTQLERGKRPPVVDKAFSSVATTSSNGSIPNGSVQKSKASSSITGRFKAKTKNFLTARMAANAFRGGIKNTHPKSYERSTRASSGRAPSLKLNNGIHPEPVKKKKSVAGSRPGSRAESRAVSRTGSRRGSIDNLVISRNDRMSMPRSKTMVLAKPKEENKPDIYTMPEEYVTDGGPNEVMPTRPIPVTSNILRDTYKSLNRRSASQLTLKKPGASKKPWH